MTPSILILSFVVLLGFAGLGLLLYYREPREDPTSELIKQLSADHVANTERILAAFVEQAKSSNEHLSGMFAQPSAQTSDFEGYLPSTISREMEQTPDLSDPTDWGDLAPGRAEVQVGTDTGLPDTFHWEVGQ